jgi:hypothetical protein
MGDCRHACPSGFVGRLGLRVPARSRHVRSKRPRTQTRRAMLLKPKVFLASWFQSPSHKQAKHLADACQLCPVARRHSENAIDVRDLRSTRLPLRSWSTHNPKYKRRKKKHLRVDTAPSPISFAQRSVYCTLLLIHPHKAYAIRDTPCAIRHVRFAVIASRTRARRSLDRP